MKKLFFLDSTLRDGAQSVGISFSVQDKFKIAKILDSLRVDYIEAGNPGSNPKDMEFFELIKEHPLSHSKVTAFGSTRRKNIAVEDDANLRSLPGGRDGMRHDFRKIMGYPCDGDFACQAARKPADDSRYRCLPSSRRARKSFTMRSIFSTAIRPTRNMHCKRWKRRMKAARTACAYATRTAAHSRMKSMTSRSWF